MWIHKNATFNTLKRQVKKSEDFLFLDLL